MKKHFYNKIMLLACLCILGQTTTAQVTIGSAQVPNKGSLLDLKDEGTYANGETAVKGLGLPRVVLKDLDKLQMSDGPDYTAQATEHTGLIVYHVTNDICAPIPAGLYLWQGSQWQGIGVEGQDRIDQFAENIDPVTGIGTVTDYEGNVYPTKRWTSTDGTKKSSIWMTKNLYSIRKEDGTYIDCPSGMRLNPAYYSTTNGAVDVKNLIPDGIVDNYTNAGTAITGQSYVDFSEEFGLLYSWNQANDACPRGWHLPTDVDWSLLAESMNSTYNGVFYPDIGHIIKMNTNKVYISADNTTYNWTEGNVVTENGFDALPSGRIGPGGVDAFAFCGYAAWWSATVSGRFWGLNYTAANLHITTDDTGHYFSVRCVKDDLGLRTDKARIHLASGHDERGAVAQQTAVITNDFPTKAVNVTKVDGAAALAGMTFNPALEMSWPSGATHNYNIKPEAMATPSATDPWQSKETYLTYKSTNDTGAETVTTVTLNQTHYAMKVNNSFNEAILQLKNTNNDNSFPVQTNNIWKVTVTDPKSILTPPTVFSGGEDKIKGDNSTTLFAYKAMAGGTGTKYQTASLLFEDAASVKRAKDVTVAVMQCQGTLDVSGLAVATPAQTSANTNWGTAVVRHQAKAGVYEEFISADFGLAGRWMTTNLSATAYDGIIHTVGRTLTGPNGNVGDAYNTAYWAYPKAPSAVTPGETASAEWTANKYLGLLYTWDAATAGKGGATGQTNVDNPAGTNAPNNESGLPEGTVAGQQKRRQGICPAGWHLPSDAEWTDLENRIKNFTTVHSTMPSNLGTTANNTPYGSPTATAISIGTAAKDVCEAGTNSSKPANEGGFSLLLAGYTSNGTAKNYGSYAYLWSSSSNNTFDVWCRAVSNDGSHMTRTILGRTGFWSVRCKKD